MNILQLNEVRKAHFLQVFGRIVEGVPFSCKYINIKINTQGIILGDFFIAQKYVNRKIFNQMCANLSHIFTTQSYYVLSD